MLHAGLILFALASHYSPGTMALVLRNRQSGNAWVSMPLELPRHDGMIAVRDCWHLGEVWTLRTAGAVDWERHLVVDCARPGDGAAEWMTLNNIMVEVGYDTAQRWGSIGGGVAVERLFGMEDLNASIDKTTD